MFLFIFTSFILIKSTLSSPSSSSSLNTFIFSAAPNTYISFDSWHPCLTGYVRFDIRTNSKDGTLAYIDDRGKFDFFYLKLLEGKPRLLFNLGSDRQAINVNMKINDDKWHTILIKRNGQTTTLSIDNGYAQNSTVTHSEDLYFGGATYNEYESSPFYFGGIPAILERPSSGNLSSFDVYMQPRFRGQLRNIIYKNCTNSHLIQPIHTSISGGVSLIPDHHCSGINCSIGICLITDDSYRCLCDETNYQGTHCQNERRTNELTFQGKQYFKYDLLDSILSSNEIITFEFKTNHYNGLLFQLIDSQIYIKLKQGQLLIEYRLNNNSWHESLTKDLYLIDNQWHYVQIKRKSEQIIILVDQHYLTFENDMKIDQLFRFHEIFIGGTHQLNIEKFHGCIKDISIIFNENLIIDLNKSSINIHEYSSIRNKNCKSLINPIQFLTQSSYISFQLKNISKQISISFRFETYSSDSILLYSQSNQDFLGFDLIDGFLYFTINTNKKRHRQELFQQRFNDGQTHYIQTNIRNYQGGLEFNITIDYRHDINIFLENISTEISLLSLTIGGINPSPRRLPTNYFSGIMNRGLIGCFFDLEINNILINLTKYINHTNNTIAPKSGPCSTILSIKRECLCEHNGECQLSSSGTWSCDCSKTGYTGRRCEQIAYHLDLNQTETYEFNSNLQWSEYINDISFGLQAMHDQLNFLQIRACRLSMSCDSIDFSIINGLLQVNFYLLNLTSEYPFLLDNQWHSIRLQRFDKKSLLHIDNHIRQQHVNINSFNASSSSSTIWIVLMGEKQIRIEDLRLYDQPIYSKLIANNQDEHMKFKYRLMKPLNAISFNDQLNSYIELKLNDILCQECQLYSIYFQFRTTELNGVLLFAMIRTDNNHKISSSSNNSIHRNNQYLILKLVNGQLHLIILQPSLPKNDNEVYKIQSNITLNNNQWHHISLYRASNYHLELQIDSNEYYLSTSLYFLNKIYIGRPIEIDFLNHLLTIKACFASLTINRHPINLREYIKPNTQIRNDCFLDSQCPLQQCRNTGICQDRIQCNCQHTSFQGRFCTNFKLGYSFDNYTPGLVFNQPYNKEKQFLLYRISFGIITKMNIAEIIRINDQLSIEIYYGFIRIKLNENDYLDNNRLINDGFYHLIQITYDITGYLSLNVDNKAVIKQLNYKLAFDKPLVLLIGQNPIFTYPFQGQLYGLESDIYSIFDLISQTFQRISFTPVRNTSLLSFSSPIIYPSYRIKDDFTRSSCPYQPNDDICMIISDTNSSLLSYSNVTSQVSLPKRIPSRSTIKVTSRTSVITSTTSYQLLTSHILNSTNLSDIPELIGSIRTPDTNRFRDKFYWQYIWIFAIFFLCSIVLCMILCICACMKYRRKDAGVYELEETQRFRPLIVEIPSSPGEYNQQGLNSTKSRTKKSNIKSHSRHKRKKSPLLTADEQREFYI
ncbi:unnamed protein product [Adineta steineri]|uniref:Uncharacterized protein n=1 Tax=Adineta steineri TaxID=433720 RepID=A0A818QY21_9BILA|nr:unnamed protein product [Adineta steineri]